MGEIRAGDRSPSVASPAVADADDGRHWGAGHGRAHEGETGQTARRAGIPSPATIPALDGVRAIACLSVVGYHISLITRDMHLWTPGHHPLLDALFLSGNSGVMLFFVLSGFLLFLPYARALVTAQPLPDARLFYLRRGWRILPGYYVSLVLIVLLQQPQYLAPSHWHELLLFLV
jgi:peptidoglycan/LPS O-acetylase OafA/YrhL